MKLRTLAITTIPILLVSTAAFSQGTPSTAIPHLEKHGTATQLVVDGKPFLVLGAELNNSSASSMEYMRPLWPKIAATNLNTVLATVSWELMEPEEGRFDFSLADGLIQDARRYNLRLIMLWFGSWKNGKSTYQPVWVKTNQQRFPLVQDEKGKGLPTLSTLSDANRDADSRAFAALMKHLREVDGEAHTVVMMQVENEVGVLGPSRDHSPAANKAFAGPVPKEFMDYLQKHKDTLIPELRQRWQAAGFKTAGSWEEVFGAGMETDELFMAWNYARYIGHVAAAGKGEYPLPMFVNTWLRQGPEKPNEDKPGGYPSGGPLPQVMDAWRAGGPAIDILSPDVHVPNYADWCAWYTQSGNPLFIPESRGDARGVAHAIATAGKYDGIGYSPFGIDRLANPEGELAKGYRVLAQVAPLILERQGLGKVTAVLVDKETPRSKVRLGDYAIEARFAERSQDPNAPVAGPVDRVAGLFIQVGPDDYVIVGRSMEVNFETAADATQSVGLATVEEGQYVDGRWVPGRRLNGDETPAWRALYFAGDRYTIQKIKLYRYR
jgi:beta-galactosidase GanA